MADDDFELLVDSIAFAELSDDQQTVRKMRAPDGGADTLVVDPEEHPLIVVQAKHTAQSINWTKCRNSLKRAIAQWDPPEVLFAFSVDFTESDQTAFAELVGKAPGRRVRAWVAADLCRLLADHAKIAPRFFGPDARGTDDIVARSIAMGGQKLETPKDLWARGAEIGKAADEMDRHFTYIQTAGSLELRRPQWEDVPWATMELHRDGVPVTRLDTWGRPESSVPLPGWRFEDSDAGRAARVRAREAMARGEKVIIDEGIELVIEQEPIALTEALATYPDMTRSELTIVPSPAVPCRICVEGDRPIDRSFELRAAFPATGYEPVFASNTHALWVELSVEPLGDDRAALHLTTSRRPSWRAQEIAEATALQLSLANGEVWIDAPDLLPEGGVHGHFGAELDADERAELEGLNDLCTELAFIERELDVELPLLAGVTERDEHVIGTVSDILRSGEGNANFERVDKVVAAHDIPHVLDDARALGVAVRDVKYELFGIELNLGPGEYELPQLKLVDVRPLGTQPDSNARVIIGAEGDGKMTFRLQRGATAGM